MINFTPYGERVFVEVINERFDFKGIALPANAQKPTNQGKILAIGDGISDPKIKVGDTIIFSEWTGMIIECVKAKLAGSPDIIYKTIPYSDIQGKVEEE